MERAPRGHARSHVVLFLVFFCLWSQLNVDVIKAVFHKRITLATKPQRGKQTGVILGKGNQITKLTRFHRQHCRWGVGGGRNSCTAELRTKSKIIINFFKKPDKSERRKNSDLDLLCSSSTDEI